MNALSPQGWGPGPPGTTLVRMTSCPVVGPCLNGFLEVENRLLFLVAGGPESAVEIRVTILALPCYMRARECAHTHAHAHLSTHTHTHTHTRTRTPESHGVTTHR